MANLEPTALSLPGVLVDDSIVGSSGFRAQVGSDVTLALEGDCYHWEYTVAGGHSRAATHSSSGRGPATQLLLTGLVRPFIRPCVLGGWVLDLGGALVLINDVQDAPATGRHADTRPTPAPPVPGRWVRLRGTLSVADDYVVSEVEQAMQRPVERRWLVQQIVPVAFHGHGGRESFAVGAPTDLIRFGRTSNSYLIDLLGPDGVAPDG